jgi:hypothetical protein
VRIVRPVGSTVDELLEAHQNRARRHYSDVPAIKGVYRGTASADLEASVGMQRTDATGARA